MIPNDPYKYDLFISSLSSDRDFVRPLVRALRDHGVTVWYDDSEIRIGADFMESIEDGLEHSRHFLFVLSPESFERPWTLFETGVAMGRTDSSKNLIIPILRGVDAQTVRTHSPLLAARAGISATDHSPSEIAEMISTALSHAELADASTSTSPALAIAE